VSILCDDPTVAQRWEEFTAVPGLRSGIRTVLCSTNAIESLNARNRKAVRALITSPQASRAQCLYLSPGRLDPTGRAKAWTMRWKPALNAVRQHVRDAGRTPRSTNQNSRNTDLLQTRIAREGGRQVRASARGQPCCSQFDAQRLVAGGVADRRERDDVSVAKISRSPSSSVHWPGCSKSSGM